MLCEVVYQNNKCWCFFQLKNFLYDRIYEAVRSGHRKLAGELMDEKAKTGQTSFNFLHRDVSATRDSK